MRGKDKKERQKRRKKKKKKKKKKRERVEVERASFSCQSVSRVDTSAHHHLTFQRRVRQLLGTAPHCP